MNSNEAIRRIESGGGTLDDLPALVAALRETREALKVALELLQGFDFATDASEDTAEEICERFKVDIQEAMLTEGGSLYHAARSIRVSLEPAPSKPNERRHREPVERVSSGPSVHQ
jgi:hypothetical protein